MCYSIVVIMTQIDFGSFSNQDLERIVLNEDNITILENEIIRTLDELFVIENRFDDECLSYKKVPNNKKELFKKLKKEVDDYLGVDKIDMPILFTPSVFNYAKSKLADISNTVLSVALCGGVLSSFIEPSLTKAAVIVSSGFLSYKIMPYSFYRKNNSRDAFFSVINLNASNYESFLTSFIHEYVHDIQRKKGFNLRNRHFMEGHARFVECEFAKEYAKKENNDFFLIYPYVEKTRDLLMTYALLCNKFSRSAKKDLFIFDLDYKEHLEFIKAHKKSFGYHESHAIGTSYFTIIQNKHPDDFYDKYVKVFN
jgi:hypothetical protein